ncbi:hypothetical protein BDV06DRAFT_155629 [Aspergillus oleicola]
MNKATPWLRGLGRRPGNVCAARAYASLSERLHQELTSRQLPLAFDYLHPQPSHLLDLTLTDLFPKSNPSSETQTTLLKVTRLSQLPPAHHLVYFPPQVTLSQLLPDGTDTLHFPGKPFNRRLWAGGSVRFLPTKQLLLDGSRAVCAERIGDVITKGQPGEEKIIVKIERHIDTVREDETEIDVRKRIWTNGEDTEAHPPVIEARDLVFMRDKSADQLAKDKAAFSHTSRTIKSPGSPEFRYQITPKKALLFRFSALTFNAHLIHLDQAYARDVEGYRNLLVHGPLTLTLLLTALRHNLYGKHLALRSIDYKNLAPVYVDEQLSICGRPKPSRDNIWDVWIENSDGGLAVRSTVHLDCTGES